MSHSSKDTSFTAERVNSTTFLIIEDDSYGERPRIYALLHPGLNVLVLSDTGCDSPREKDGMFDESFCCFIQVSFCVIFWCFCVQYLCIFWVLFLDA